MCRGTRGAVAAVGAVRRGAVAAVRGAVTCGVKGIAERGWAGDQPLSGERASSRTQPTTRKDGVARYR